MNAPFGTTKDCKSEGCIEPAMKHGLCKRHFGAVVSKKDSGPGTRAGRPLTDAERDEIRRRVRSWESPINVARAMGITKASVLNVMNQR